MGRQAVILCGGAGSRLGPHRTLLPKPLMPVGNNSILDVVVRQLAAQGLDRLTLTLGNLAPLIQAVLGNGERYGVSMTYHREPEPLGTAGALALLDQLDDTFLVMNGDILTSLDYRRLWAAHVSSGNALTIAAQHRTVEADYGVLHLNGEAGGTRRVTGYEEKPVTGHTVSMGVYVFDRRVLEHITPGERLDVPDLITRLIDAGDRVGSYLDDGHWFDLGRQDHYAQVVEEFSALAPEVIPGWSPGGTPD